MQSTGFMKVLHAAVNQWYVSFKGARKSLQELQPYSIAMAACLKLSHGSKGVRCAL